jgi:hypothetical protein
MWCSLLIFLLSIHICPLIFLLVCMCGFYFLSLSCSHWLIFSLGCMLLSPHSPIVISDLIFGLGSKGVSLFTTFMFIIMDSLIFLIACKFIFIFILMDTHYISYIIDSVWVVVPIHLQDYYHQPNNVWSRQWVLCLLMTHCWFTTHIQNRM